MKIMKHIGKLLCIALAIIIVCSPITAYADQVEDQSISNGCHTIDGSHPLLGTDPLANTQAAILYEVTTDTLVYAWNPDVRMSPSSITKLVTAIVAIEQGNLSDVVVADELTLSTIPWDAVSSNIQAGEEMPLLDLLYCMLVGSGNDAAAVIAVYMDGSFNKFADRMNAFVASIGCTNSHFTNPHGLHDNDQYTTARDVAKILSYATKNETFVKLIGAKNYTVAATNLKGERYLTTSNYLMDRSLMSLYYDSRVTGGRTGAANDGSRCLAATAQKGSLNYISVVMGCRNTYSSDGSINTFGGFPETTALLDLGFQGLRAAQIFSPGQVLKQYPLANADANLYIGVNDSRKSVIPNGVDTDDLRYVFEESGILSAPIAQGTSFGDVNVYYGSTCIASAPLYALNKVKILEETVINDRVSDSSKRLSAGLVLAIIAVAFFVILILLRYNKMLRKIIVKRRRRKRSAL